MDGGEQLTLSLWLTPFVYFASAFPSLTPPPLALAVPDPDSLLSSLTILPESMGFPKCISHSLGPERPFSLLPLTKPQLLPPPRSPWVVSERCALLISIPTAPGIGLGGRKNLSASQDE